jgi:hypothetical protein
MNLFSISNLKERASRGGAIIHKKELSSVSIGGNTNNLLQL